MFDPVSYAGTGGLQPWRCGMDAAICVFCGSAAGRGDRYVRAAEELARALVARNIGLVYGGASTGLMGTVADAVLARGGSAVGVIPQTLADRGTAHLNASPPCGSEHASAHKTSGERGVALRFRVHDVKSGRAAQALRVRLEQGDVTSGAPARPVSVVTDRDGTADVPLPSGQLAMGVLVRFVAEVGPYFRAEGYAAGIEELSVALRMAGGEFGGEVTLLLSPAGLTVAWVPHTTATSAPP